MIAQSPDGSITAISDPVLKTTRIQNNATRTPTWQIPVWSRWLYVANDGKHMVTGYNGRDIGGMDLIPQSNDGALVLFTFWRDGKKVKEVLLRDFIQDERIIEEAVTGYFWGRVEEINLQNQLLVRRADGRVIVFDLDSGSEIWLSPRVEDHPQKELIRKNLQALCARSTRIRENHFFIYGENEAQVWIYWREGRILWTTDWEPYYDEGKPDTLSTETRWQFRILFPHHPYELDSGVVPREEDRPSGSNYIVAKHTVAGIAYDCVLNGELVEISPADSKQSSARISFQKAVVPVPPDKR